MEVLKGRHGEGGRCVMGDRVAVRVLLLLKLWADRGLLGGRQLIYSVNTQDAGVLVVSTEFEAPSRRYLLQYTSTSMYLLIGTSIVIS